MCIRIVLLASFLAPVHFALARALDAQWCIGAEDHGSQSVSAVQRLGGWVHEWWCGSAHGASVVGQLCQCASADSDDAATSRHKQKSDTAGQFQARKRALLAKLAQAIDRSPKGSLDAPICDLIHFINGTPAYVRRHAGNCHTTRGSSDNCPWLHMVFVCVGLPLARR